MKNNFTKNYKYLISSQHDDDWGITVNTVGCETICKNYETYPPRTGHPAQFFFTPSRGRKLDSYQLLYITKGKGIFFTSPEENMEIKEGDMIIYCVLISGIAICQTRKQDGQKCGLVSREQTWTADSRIIFSIKNRLYTE